MCVHVVIFTCVCFYLGSGVGLYLGTVKSFAFALFESSIFGKDVAADRLLAIKALSRITPFVVSIPMSNPMFTFFLATEKALPKEIAPLILPTFRVVN